MPRSTNRRKKIQTPRAITQPATSTQLADEPTPESDSIWLSFLPLIACACVVVLFFRDFFEFGFDRVAGDIGDNRFIIAILEHWRHVFLGHVPDFTSPSFFYPERGALGLSESLFLFAIPYAIARAAGTDMALSFQLTLVAVKVIGFWGMFLLARRFLNVGIVLATFAAALFSMSNMYFMSVTHAQLSSVAFIPWVALLGSAYCQKRTQGKVLLCRFCVISAAVLTALILFTSFYIGWFMLLLTSVLALTTLLVFIVYKRSLRPFLRFIRTVNLYRLDLLLSVLAFSIAIVPFIKTYLPALQRTGGRNFDEVAMYMASPMDLYNLGPLNVVWARLLNPYFQLLSLRSSHFEMAVGWPPATTGVFAVLITTASWRICKRSRQVTPSLLFVAAAGIACTCLWLMTILYKDFAPWWYIFRFIPGAVAIRVPPRFNGVLNALGVVAIVAGLSHVIGRKLPGMRNAAIWCVLLFLLIEQINLHRFHLISRKNEAAVFSRVSAPPHQCKSFYVTSAASPDWPFYATHIDAMLLSQQLHLPTLNGYSGWFPAGWKLVLFDKDYVENARRWAVNKGISSGLCSLDLSSGTWTIDNQTLDAHKP